jgi:hypothetical protein
MHATAIPLATGASTSTASPLTLQCPHDLSETAMKFRWSEWLIAAALVLAFSAFAGTEAAEQTSVDSVDAVESH